MKQYDSWFSEYPRFTFNEYSRYLKLQFNQTVFRVSVDAGFTCPHREKSENNAGCIYCDAKGSRAPYLGNIEEMKLQIRSAKRFLRARYGAKRFMLYFQAFSNTYASCADLKKIYDAGLRESEFCALIVSTRPDCIDREKAALLASYECDNLDVWVELGLQSANPSTLSVIKRGHSLSDFEKAYVELKERDLKISVHLIFGLPGEGWEEIERTVRFIASLKPDGIKIHNLHIPYETEIARMYLHGEIIAPGFERHRDYVIRALELLPQKTLVMRVTCDTRISKLLSPRRFVDKGTFYSSLRDDMVKRNTWQGRLYSP
jgi:uncharacterized protein